MEGQTGLEPANFCLEGRRVSQLHHYPKYGLSDAIWTRTLLRPKQAFYQVELHPDIGATSRILTYEELSDLQSGPLEHSGMVA